jgi:hypothetical protein
MYNIFALLLSFLSFFGSTHDHATDELQGELKRANKELKQVESRVRHLQEKLAAQQIKFIQREIELFKGQIDALDLASEEKTLSLFHEERALLAEIIQKVPMHALEAQHVLDQILSLITLLSDKI